MCELSPAQPGRAETPLRNPTEPCILRSPIGLRRCMSRGRSMKRNVLTVVQVEAARISHDRALRTSTEIEPTKINKNRAETKSRFCEFYNLQRAFPEVYGKLHSGPSNAIARPTAIMYHQCTQHSSRPVHEGLRNLHAARPLYWFRVQTGVV